MHHLFMIDSIYCMVLSRFTESFHVIVTDVYVCVYVISDSLCAYKKLFPTLKILLNKEYHNITHFNFFIVEYVYYQRSKVK